MTVRPATHADLPAILALERSAPEAPHWSEAIYKAILTHTPAEPPTTAVRRAIFCRDSPEGLSGFAVGMVLITESTRGEIENVVVAPHSRRSGIGCALCAAVLSWCRHQGADAVELEVRASSAGAIALYRSLGFTIVGCRSRYYRQPEEDAVEMTLRWPTPTDPLHPALLSPLF
jgi:ribosomal-protein-alanine N-acetyltransferase